MIIVRWINCYGLDKKKCSGVIKSRVLLKSSDNEPDIHVSPNFTIAPVALRPAAGTKIRYKFYKKILSLLTFKFSLFSKALDTHDARQINNDNSVPINRKILFIEYSHVIEI